MLHMRKFPHPTLMPCMNHSDSHKPKLLVVGKAKIPYAFTNIKQEPLPVVCTAKTWGIPRNFQRTNGRLFKPFCKFFKQNKLPLKALRLHKMHWGQLLVDAGDLKIKTRDEFVKITFLPANTTALIKMLTLDQNVIKTMKMHYKKRLSMGIVSSQVNDISTLLKQFNIKDAVFNSV